MKYIDKMEILHKWRPILGDLNYFQLMVFLHESKKDALIHRMLVISSPKQKLQKKLLSDIMSVFDENDFTNELYSEKSLTTKRFLIVKNPEKNHFVKKILHREDCTIKSIFYSSTFIPTVNVIALTNMPFFMDPFLEEISIFIHL